MEGSPLLTETVITGCACSHSVSSGEDDKIGREVQRRLSARAKAGERVYFLYDELGGHNLPRAYLDTLRSAGEQIYDFHTRKEPRNRFQINFRNHRKMVGMDGKTAWTRRFNEV
jgi:cardiolipin synthase